MSSVCRPAAIPTEAMAPGTPAADQPGRRLRATEVLRIMMSPPCAAEAGPGLAVVTRQRAAGPGWPGFGGSQRQLNFSIVRNRKYTSGITSYSYLCYKESPKETSTGR